MVVLFVTRYKNLVKQSSCNVVINNILNLESNNKVAVIEGLFEDKDITKLIYKNIIKSSCRMEKFIESFSFDTDQVSILVNAIALFEPVKKRIAVTNPILVGDLEQYAEDCE